MSVFRWVLLTLASFRITRVIITDSWPPAEAFREWIADRCGEDSAWYDFITCPWCAGTYVTIAVFAVASQLLVLELPVLQAVAAMAAVGYLGTYDQPSVKKR